MGRAFCTRHTRVSLTSLSSVSKCDERKEDVPVPRSLHCAADLRGWVGIHKYPAPWIRRRRAYAASTRRSRAVGLRVRLQKNDDTTIMRVGVYFYCGYMVISDTCFLRLTAARPPHKMDIKVWGPHAWATLHTMSFAYPADDPPLRTRQAALDMIMSLRHLMPCPACRQHLAQYLDDPTVGISDAQSVHLDDRARLSRWIFDLHSAVNRRLGKSSPLYSRVAEMYTKHHNMCGASPPAPDPAMHVGLPVATLLLAGGALLLCVGVAWAASAAERTRGRDQEHALLELITRVVAADRRAS